MKELPIGIQTFSKIINENRVYIDKTEHIYKLLKNPLYYFLSRPRRFGKSLLLDTLEEVFKGNKDLFKGLYIEHKISWEAYPIVRLSFDKLNTSKDAFGESLGNALKNIAENNGIDIKSTYFKEVADELITKLCKQTGKRVVILIDEYDRPLLNYLNTDIAEINRDIVREFFTTLKSLDSQVHFVFITGVSKFSQVSLFSGANNLTDITIDPSFATVCGYTQSDLEYHFDDRIDLLAQYLNLTKEEVLLEMKKWYNGYSWNGEAVYNPFSILRLFQTQSFGNYWFETGSPSFLIKVLFSDFKYRFKNIKTSINLLTSGFDIKHIEPTSLMFQAGYLTIKGYDHQTRRYTLDYPNQEVKESLQEYLLQTFSHQEHSAIQSIAYQIYDALIANDIDLFVSLTNTLFSQIPEPIFIAQYEAYYQSILYLVFSLMGIETQAESPTNKGRIDTVVPTPDRIFVIEYKIGKGAATAMKQIENQAYYEKYLHQGKDIVLMGLALGKEKRGIVEKKIKVIKQ